MFELSLKQRLFGQKKYVYLKKALLFFSFIKRNFIHNQSGFESFEINLIQTHVSIDFKIQHKKQKSRLIRWMIKIGLKLVSRRCYLERITQFQDLLLEKFSSEITWNN